MIRTLAGGLMVAVDKRGKAAPMTCNWLVQVYTATLYPPEAEWYPDSPADVFTDIECGARLFDDGHGSYHCEHGHEHVSYADPSRHDWELYLMAWEKEMDK